MKTHAVHPLAQDASDATAWKRRDAWTADVRGSTRGFSAADDDAVVDVTVRPLPRRRLDRTCR